MQRDNKKGRDAVRIPAKTIKGRFCNQFGLIPFRTPGGVVSFRLACLQTEDEESPLPTVPTEKT